MIYIAFTFWLFLIIFTGIGLYRMLGYFTNRRWVDWALLPGTIVSEMAYIFGCLITGAEVRHAKLISSQRSSSRRYKSSRDPDSATTEAMPKLKIAGPIIAALVAIIGCMVAIVLVHVLLGQPVMSDFTGAQLPQTLQGSYKDFWTSLHGQVGLLRQMWEMWVGVNWLNWRVPLFVYLAACLSIRLAPVTRPVRPTLAAAVVIAAGIAVAGAINRNFQHLIKEIWPLLTYVWASLLFLLLVVLLIRSGIYLANILAGKRAV